MTDEEKTVDIDDVMRAMSSAIDAKINHDKELDEYDGRSWGYHGASLIAEKDQAIKRYGERLDAYIDQRIRAALANR